MSAGVPDDRRRKLPPELPELNTLIGVGVLNKILIRFLFAQLFSLIIYCRHYGHPYLPACLSLTKHVPDLPLVDLTRGSVGRETTMAQR